MTTQWPAYTGNGRPRAEPLALPPPPSWRPRRGAPPAVGRDLPDAGETAFRPGDPEIEAVNAALFLRRPLLITGKPGVGKSSLARAVAHELGLGPVLWWPITTRSSLQDALYRYDAVGRLQETKQGATTGAEEPAGGAGIGSFIRLGPLGTALLPAVRPRVLLIDEIDKGDVDLPNELLHVFEKGEFEIPELKRLGAGQLRVAIRADDGDDPVEIENGTVTCHEFPLVFLTSNGEREFSPAFMRRCIRVEMKAPSDVAGLADVVRAHLGAQAAADAEQLIGEFLARRTKEDLATDQLLNAVYLSGLVAGEDKAKVLDLILKSLSGSGST